MLPCTHQKPGIARWLRWGLGMMLVTLTCTAVQAQTYWSEDPSDATDGLLFTTAEPMAPAWPTNCAQMHGVFDMGNVSSSTAESWPSNGTLQRPPCGVDQPIMPNAIPPDMWFRLDPPAQATAFRFTLYTDLTQSINAARLATAGMALYEAPSANGPFRLLACSKGGSATASLPTLETSTGYTPGYKLYLRMWSLDGPPLIPGITRHFNLCVQGHTLATMPNRNAGETACTAQTLTVNSGVNPETGGTGVTAVDYVFSADESTTGDGLFAGGDLWLKAVVPANGNLQFKAGPAQLGPNRIGRLAMTAYLSDDCADQMRFIDLGTWTGSLGTSWTAIGNAQLRLSCLTPGAIVYLRIHSPHELQAFANRYGQFKIKAGGASGTMAVPSNNDPCGAIALDYGDGYPTGVYTESNNIGACPTIGVPAPGCDMHPAAHDVWYKFEAPPTGIVQLDVMGTGPFGLRPGMALYTNGNSSCDTLNLGYITCDRLHGSGDGARIVQGGLTPGQTYYLRVWGWATDTQEGVFRIYLKGLGAAPDHCLYMVKVSHWEPYMGCDLGPQNDHFPGALLCAPEYYSGTSTIEVTINGGAPVLHTTDGNEMNELFLIEVPAGGTLKVTYMNTMDAPNPPFGAGQPYGVSHYSLWRVGQGNPLWFDTFGVAMFGPADPGYSFTVNPTCDPIIHPSSDCLGVKTMCVGSDFLSNGPQLSSSNLGNINELGGADMGCLEGESGGIQWAVFRPEADGALSFRIGAGGNTATTDLDFAVWDVGELVYEDPEVDVVNGDYICPPPGPPIRCSSARYPGATGLATGFTQTFEGNEGWGWLAPLPVQANHVYLVAVTLHSGADPTIWTLYWTGFHDSSGNPIPMDCAPLVLPVELLFLNADTRGHEVDLAWATASEKNSSHYIVERSNNMQDFTAIGRVEAHGNSSQRIDYHFTDTDPYNGVNYYRLQQVDLDGTTEQSNTVVAVVKGNGNGIMAYPNPVRDQLKLALDLPDQGTVTIEVRDALGRVVRHEQRALAIAAQSLEVDVRDLARSTYLIRVLAEDGTPLGSTRFTKQ